MGDVELETGSAAVPVDCRSWSLESFMDARPTANRDAAGSPPTLLAVATVASTMRFLPLMIERYSLAELIEGHERLNAKLLSGGQHSRGRGQAGHD